MYFARLFSTDLGWIGFLRDNENCLHHVRIGWPSKRDLLGCLKDLASFQLSPTSPFDDELQARLTEFARGQIVDFHDITINQCNMTEFQRRVVDCCRQIPRGRTCGYGELADRAGYKGAARAVGTVMSRNEFPIIVPCHRVVTAARKLGGFSAPQGVRLKQRLLDLESQSIRPPHVSA